LSYCLLPNVFLVLLLFADIEQICGGIEGVVQQWVTTIAYWALVAMWNWNSSYLQHPNILCLYGYFYNQVLCYNFFYYFPLCSSSTFSNVTSLFNIDIFFRRLSYSNVVHSHAPSPKGSSSYWWNQHRTFK